MGDHYANTKSQTGDTMSLLKQLGDSVGNGLWYVRWRFEQIRAREPVGPSFQSMLDDLLALGQASADVVESTETSVLGPRMLRHKTEAKRFNERITQPVVEDENDPIQATTIKEDFKEMKVDKEMGERLIDGCRAYFERQSLPQETRVAQMRDLVKHAEEGFLKMSKRFEECDQNLNGILRQMSSHVQTLELTSHSTLGDLARTAQEVGVPEAVGNKGPSKEVESRVISHLYQNRDGRKRRARGPDKNSQAMKRVNRVIQAGMKFTMFARKSSRASTRASRASISQVLQSSMTSGASPTGNDRLEQTA